MSLFWLREVCFVQLSGCQVGFSFDYFLEENRGVTQTKPPLSFELSTSLSKTKKELFNLTMISNLMLEWFLIFFKYDFHLYKLMLE